MIKSQFNKNNVATIKNKSKPNKDLITRVCRIRAMVPMECSYSKMVYLPLLTSSLSILVKTFCSHTLE